MGLHGQSANTDAGVWGENTDSGPGVLGTSSDGPGVTGVSSHNPAVLGRSDTADAVLGRSVSGNGVRGQSGSGTGVVGASSANDGVAGQAKAFGKSGVLGSNPAGNGVTGSSQDGTGVAGQSVTGNGMRAESVNNDGLFARAQTPGKSGVWGFNPSERGAGVAGTSIQGNGVYGRSDRGPGVFGESGSNDGVAGYTRARGGSGVFGHNPNDWGQGVTGLSEQGIGVYARSDVGPSVYAHSGGGPGVFAESDRNDAVFGQAHVAGKSGVVGVNPHVGGNGVAGVSDQGTGVYGRSPFGNGVYGVSYRAGLHGDGQGSGIGVYGHAEGPAGVLGHADNGNGVSGSSLRSDINGAAVFGISRRPDYSANLNGYAGVFIGKVYVAGELQKGGGGFKIDHPLDPANAYLNHSFVESDARKNVYDGTVVLDEHGAATVVLPPWFERLNREVRYQLTAIGAPAPELHIAAEVANNHFRIAGGRAGLKVCWQVTGIRQDAWAQAFPLVVEEVKSTDAAGAYLHPGLSEELHGAGIGWGAPDDVTRRLLEERSTPLDEQLHLANHHRPRSRTTDHAFGKPADEKKAPTQE
jgi:hypothetical protein